jgi:hypothetical protein
LIRESIYVNEEWVKDKNNYNQKTGGQSAGILSDISKNKISETLKLTYNNGYVSCRKGKKLGPLSDEHKSKISETLKEMYFFTPHHFIGVEPWNKGTKGLQVAWNKGIETGPMSGKEI